MALLSPAALATLMRGGGRRGGVCVRRSRHPPGVLHSPSLSSSAPPQPVIAAKQPFPVELKAGKKYGWCACGHSRSQPFCDGTHKKAAPGISPLRFTPEEDKTALLCGCKRTRSPPYCDGTHKEEAVQSAQLPPQP
ncbi:CDGSH iron-sulfur domain-containing protein 3, mitochondrial [Ciconia boyciana]|uniref:CDGSH iron-sulfur domain-containing protein 3, mitochondrial n=1 Tax=Ciconia boyciana TaxID=52775 RepID=UPI002154C2C9